MRDGVNDGVEQGTQIFAGLVNVASSGPQLRVGVEHGKIELVFRRIEVNEQVIHLVEHFLRARVGPVNLVDHEDGRQLRLQRFAQHVARLRQRALTGVHQQHHAIDHL